MDLRIENIMFELKANDKSFTEKAPLGGLFGEIKYKQPEVREIWFQAMGLGIEEGLRRASLEGQRIELNANTTDEKHLEFLDKFNRLASEYKCRVQYHPTVGMVVIDTDPDR